MSAAGFRRSMIRGLGRCQLELSSAEEREKYRPVLLWGCTHDLAFDLQCEGTKAEYLYQLISSYDDPDYFAAPVAERFLKCSCARGTEGRFEQYCELLLCFAGDGNAAALNALRSKYDWLLAELRRRRGDTLFPKRDCFQHMCVCLTSFDGMDGFLKLTADLGALFRDNKRLGAADFDWFWDHAKLTLGQARVQRALERRRADEDIGRFLADVTRWEKRLTQARRPPSTPLPAEELAATIRSGRGHITADSLRFARKASDEERRRFAELLLAEPEDDIKARMLLVFRRSPFPLGGAPLIELASRGEEDLRRAALEALGLLRDGRVRALALELLERGERTAEAIAMIARNYHPADKERLLSALGSLAVTRENESNWHGAVLSLLDAASGGRARLPAEAFMYIYESSLCACCRHYAVIAMGRRRMLTERLLTECLCDSYQETREYARRKLASRRAGAPPSGALPATAP